MPSELQYFTIIKQKDYFKDFFKGFKVVTPEELEKYRRPGREYLKV